MQAPPIQSPLVGTQQRPIHPARRTGNPNPQNPESPEHREVIRDFRARQQHFMHDSGILQRPGFVHLPEAKQKSPGKRMQNDHQTDPFRVEIPS